MTTRTHLSISEVLSLLKEDFPDLTITKIRYLESQGLIDPERTASGYRKFYKFDIERLRWILRQQRENFLPLKVIKKRLDSTDGKLTDEPVESAEQAELDLARDPGKADPPPVWMADHAKATAGTRADAQNSDEVNVDQSPSSDEDAVAAVSSQEPAASKIAEKPIPPSGQSVAPGPPPASALPATATTGPVAKGVLRPDPPKSPAVQAPPVTPTPTGEANTRPTSASTSNASAAEGANQLDSGPSDVSLSRGELLKATGLTERQLADLESFNIVVGLDGAHANTFGSSALISARHAATLLSLGIEARHLRAYKVAADREAGLYEQLLLPLLRQRNPASRAEAMQVLDRVTRAGSAIHAALLKQALRNMLRPGS